MSTLAYAQLTNKRDDAAPGTSETTNAPGVKSYVDALAALVPAEVLTLHALVISATTTIGPTKQPRFPRRQHYLGRFGGSSALAQFYTLHRDFLTISG